MRIACKEVSKKLLFVRVAEGLYNTPDSAYTSTDKLPVQPEKKVWIMKRLIPQVTQLLRPLASSDCEPKLLSNP